MNCQGMDFVKVPLQRFTTAVNSDMCQINRQVERIRRLENNEDSDEYHWEINNFNQRISHLRICILEIEKCRMKLHSETEIEQFDKIVNPLTIEAVDCLNKFTVFLKKRSHEDYDFEVFEESTQKLKNMLISVNQTFKTSHDNLQNIQCQFNEAEFNSKIEDSTFKKTKMNKLALISSLAGGAVGAIIGGPVGCVLGFKFGLIAGTSSVSDMVSEFLQSMLTKEDPRADLAEFIVFIELQKSLLEVKQRLNHVHKQLSVK
ncbi:uncharacterized protein LOC115227180 [Octopus sinensis]|uniref:Uncharacterized protein LOC115227180 n=1 Tax=Octopus sinensis TaxID=2607531 RepID=A0A6P7TQD9_9MOLL|nr:uncharacterized protein LOC115227180 [Octopus sinensis]